MFRGRGLAGLLAATAVAALSSCGNPTPSHSPSRVAKTTSVPRPSAPATPCASVITTTPIADVPAACAALWAPYGVTKIPPVNLTDAAPAPPVVVNETQGAISDAQLHSWVIASTRASLWYRWAEANDQSGLMSHLGRLKLIPPAELQAMATGETVQQPDCALFPTRVVLFPITASDRRFFLSEGESVKADYALVGRYPGPCLVTAQAANGQAHTLASYPTAGITFFATYQVNDPLLGTLLFTDGAGNCSDRGAPTAWCSA